MSENPLISFVVPVHNGAQYLAAAVESLLAQTYSNVEILVIDDGSTDESASVARSFGEKIRFFEQESQGVWKTRNDGIGYAKADFLALHDADDLAVPQRAEIQMQALQANPQIGFVFGHMIEFNGAALPAIDSLAESTEEKIEGICPGTALIRREVFDRVGEFERTWNVAGFLDWFMRAKDSGVEFLTVPEVVLARRVHSENSTLKEKTDLPQQYLSVIRAGIARRRNENPSED